MVLPGANKFGRCGFEYLRQLVYIKPPSNESKSSVGISTIHFVFSLGSGRRQEIRRILVTETSQVSFTGGRSFNTDLLLFFEVEAPIGVLIRDAVGHKIIKAPVEVPSSDESSATACSCVASRADLFAERSRCDLLPAITCVMFSLIGACYEQDS